MMQILYIRTCIAYIQTDRPERERERERKRDRERAREIDRWMDR